MTTLSKIVTLMFVVLAVMTFSTVHAAAPGGDAGAAPGAAPGGMGGGMGGGGGRRGATPADNTPRTLSPFFAPATTTPKAPDADGFMQRWMILEPITNGLRGNTGFTEAWVRANLIEKEYFPKQLEVTPKDGEKVTVDGNVLAWHAVDTSTFNAKLFRFAYGLNKTTYGVTFWYYTVIDCPEEIKNVRLACGVNGTAIWWVNGVEAVSLFTDRRMVQDDCVSKRLTLKKGKNIVRGGLINGPGLSDFCARFIDENDQPVKNYTMSLDLGK
jgi:hypothetical protein